MKKRILGTATLVALSAVVVVVLRRFGPALHGRAMKKCQEMMGHHMAQESPPKQDTDKDQEDRAPNYQEKEQQSQAVAI